MQSIATYTAFRSAGLNLRLKSILKINLPFRPSSHIHHSRRNLSTSPILKSVMASEYKQSVTWGHNTTQTSEKRDEVYLHSISFSLINLSLSISGCQTCQSSRGVRAQARWCRLLHRRGADRGRAADAGSEHKAGSHLEVRLPKTSPSCVGNTKWNCTVTMARSTSRRPTGLLTLTRSSKSKCYRKSCRLVQHHH